MADGHDRDAWERHPNIHALAGMLLGVHDSFRQGAAQLVALLAQGESLPRIRRSFEPLATTLHHHHRLEETMLFPVVAQSAGSFPTALVDDHRALTAAIDATSDALLGEDTDETRRAIAALQTCLAEHLDREEALVIPILLEMDRADMLRLLGIG